MSFNKNSSSNNKFAVLVKQFTRERQTSDPLPIRATLAPPAHASVRPKSPHASAQPSSSHALAQSTSNRKTRSKPVFTTSVKPLKVVNKLKLGSYAHTAARGVSPGSTITLQSWSKSLHPIWDPACLCIEEWLKFDKDNFVFTKNRLGSSFHTIYKAHNEYIPFGKGDVLVTKYQNPQRKSMNGFLISTNPAYHHQI